MFLHLFQIVVNFLYVCQSVSWLTSLLKLDKYRDISSSGRDIFLKFSGDTHGMLAHKFQINLNFLYVCQSVSQLTSLLKLDKYSDIQADSILQCNKQYIWAQILFKKLMKMTNYLKLWYYEHNFFIWGKLVDILIDMRRLDPKCMMMHVSWSWSQSQCLPF